MKHGRRGLMLVVERRASARQQALERCLSIGQRLGAQRGRLFLGQQSRPDLLQQAQDLNPRRYDLPLQHLVLPDSGTERRAVAMAGSATMGRGSHRDRCARGRRTTGRRTGWHARRWPVRVCRRCVTVRQNHPDRHHHGAGQDQRPVPFPPQHASTILLKRVRSAPALASVDLGQQRGHFVQLHVDRLDGRTGRAGADAGRGAGHGGRTR